MKKSGTHSIRDERNSVDSTCPSKRHSLLEGDLNKSDVKKMIHDELSDQFDKLDKKFLTKKDVKEMIRSTIVAQYKYLWEKSAFFINQI